MFHKADEWEPPLPDALPDGNYPAIEYSLVSMARKIIRHRRRVGLTQKQLAERAGIRLSTLKRIERGDVMPSVRTIEKIERALREAELSLTKAK
jgi:predicted transcriptional regulator